MTHALASVVIMGPSGRLYYYYYYLVVCGQWHSTRACIFQQAKLAQQEIPSKNDFDFDPYFRRRHHPPMPCMS